MAEEKKSKLDELNRYIEERVSAGVDEMRADVESKLEQKLSKAPAVHTESRTSEWTEDSYQVGQGEAFREGLVAMYRAYDKEGHTKNAASYAEDAEYAKRFLGNSAQGGANLVPEILAEDVIPQLYKRLVMMAAGVTVIPMQHKKLPIGRQNVRAIAAHVGEGIEIPENGPEFGQLELDAKKVTARADVANDWLRSDPRAALDFVANDLMKAVAQLMDTQALEGTGSATAPTGVFSQIAAGNKVTWTAAAGQVSGTADFEQKLDEVEQKLLDANVNPADIAVIMGDRDFLYSRRQRDSGVLVFPELRDASPSLIGKPVYRTNIIANDRDDSADGDNDESRIYMGDFASILFGILKTMEIAFSTDQRFTYDETICRLVAHYDVQLRRDTDIAVLSTDVSA